MNRSARFSVLFLLFMVFSFVYTSEAHAISDRCPRHQVQTELKSKREKTRFFHSSVNGINSYLSSHSVLAFVQNPLRIVPQFKFEMQEIGNGKYCVNLDKVRVYYVASPRIVMPSDFSKGSCEYKIILKHEKRHLQVHYDYHNSSTKEYEALLGRAARNVPVFPPVTTQKEADQVKEAIANYFSEQFFVRVAESIEEMRVLQRKIDSPQEYTFTGRKIDRCAQDEERKNNPNKKLYQNHKH